MRISHLVLSLAFDAIRLDHQGFRLHLLRGSMFRFLRLRQRIARHLLFSGLYWLGLLHLRRLRFFSWGGCSRSGGLNGLHPSTIGCARLCPFKLLLLVLVQDGCNHRVWMFLVCGKACILDTFSRATPLTTSL